MRKKWIFPIKDRRKTRTETKEYFQKERKQEFSDNNEDDDER